MDSQRLLKLFRSMVSLRLLQILTIVVRTEQTTQKKLFFVGCPKVYDLDRAGIFFFVTAFERPLFVNPSRPDEKQPPPSDGTMPNL